MCVCVCVYASDHERETVCLGERMTKSVFFLCVCVRERKFQWNTRFLLKVLHTQNQENNKPSSKTNTCALSSPQSEGEREADGDSTRLCACACVCVCVYVCVCVCVAHSEPEPGLQDL